MYHTYQTTYPRSFFLILLHAWYRLYLLWIQFCAHVYDQIDTYLQKKKNIPLYQQMPTHVAIISPMYSSSSSTKSMSLIQKSLKDIVNAIIECSTWHQLQSVSVLMTEGEEDRLRLLSQLKKCSPTRNLTISTPLVSQLTRNDVGEEVLVLQGIEPNPSSSVSTITSSSSSSSSSSSLQVYLLTPQFHGKSLITQFRERVPGHSLTYLSDLFPDPDLLIVPYPILTLHGYPPWQLRLTEIYYEKGLSRLSLGLLRRSLKRYQKVQHRYGR